MGGLWHWVQCYLQDRYSSICLRDARSATHPPWRVLETRHGCKLERLHAKTAAHQSHTSAASQINSLSPTSGSAPSCCKECHPWLVSASVASHTPTVPVRMPTSSSRKERCPRPALASAASQTVSTGPLPSPRPTLAPAVCHQARSLR